MKGGSGGGEEGGKEREKVPAQLTKQSMQYKFHFFLIPVMTFLWALGATQGKWRQLRSPITGTL